MCPFVVITYFMKYVPIAESKVFIDLLLQFQQWLDMLSRFKVQ